jgi:hypothetical protein
MFAFPARAQDFEAARVAFEACRVAEDQGDFARACDQCGESFKLVQSQAAAAGLSRCEEARGRIAMALQHEERGLKLLRPTDPNYAARKTLAENRIRSLLQRVPTLRLVWHDQGVQLKIDNTLVSQGAESLRLDPGAHALEVTAVGHDAVKQTITLAESEERTFEVLRGPELTGAPSGRLPGEEPAPAADDGDGQRLAAFVVGGIGVLGVVGFAITGGLVLDRQATVDADCDSVTRRCANGSEEAAAEGRTLNVVNAVALGLGAAGLATGLILYVTAPDGSTEPAAVEVGLASDHLGLVLKGTF